MRALPSNTRNPFEKGLTPNFNTATLYVAERGSRDEIPCKEVGQSPAVFYDFKEVLT